MQRNRVLIVLVVLATLIAGRFGLWLGSNSRVAPPPVSAIAITQLGSPVKKALSVSSRDEQTNPLSAIAPTKASSAIRSRPSEIPLKAKLADLLARANAGDAEAASRLFRDMEHCKHAQQVSEALARPPSHIPPHSPSDHEEDHEQQIFEAEAEFRSRERNLQLERDNVTFCADLNDADYDQVLPMSSILLQAALGGDTVAAGCYLEFGMVQDQHLVANHPEWVFDYQQNAIRVANIAIEQGDWTAVEILQWSYQGRPEADLLSQVTGQDDIQDYRFSKLLRLGAPLTEPVKDFYDRLIANLATQIGTDEQRNADAWALDIYQRYFSANQPAKPTEGLYACRTDDL